MVIVIFHLFNSIYTCQLLHTAKTSCLLNNKIRLDWESQYNDHTYIHTYIRISFVIINDAYLTWVSFLLGKLHEIALS